MKKLIPETLPELIALLEEYNLNGIITGFGMETINEFPHRLGNKMITSINLELRCVEKSIDKEAKE